jgi:hypothetical protein
MENQKYSPKLNRPVPESDDTQTGNTQDENKERSVLDKLKEQIKKIKELKEKGPGGSD